MKKKNTFPSFIILLIFPRSIQYDVIAKFLQVIDIQKYCLSRTLGTEWEEWYVPSKSWYAMEVLKREQEVSYL